MMDFLLVAIVSLVVILEITPAIQYTVVVHLPAASLKTPDCDHVNPGRKPGSTIPTMGAVGL